MNTIGSLFSGIGGLELGLERAGLGKTVWQCEKDEFCRSRLANHWPDVERYNDVTDAAFPHADIICGGFPCQDLSHAGKRRGIRAERSGLWFQYLRVVREIRPAWVIVENVYQAWRAWMPIVRSGLAELGYASLPLRVSADEVGAWHRRARGFVVADSDGHIIRQQSGGAQGRCGPVRFSLYGLARRGLLPTLTVCGNYNRAGLTAKSGDGLATALVKAGAKPGPLNPRWTEAFMGFPVGWLW